MTPIIYPTNTNMGIFPALFNELFGNDWTPAKHRCSSPAINVAESDTAYTLEVAAPGMTKEDFTISLSCDGELVIAMEKKTENTDEQKDKKYLRREFCYSKFEKRFTLPEDIQKEQISAQMTDGVLAISLPKISEEEKAKETLHIEIK